MESGVIIRPERAEDFHEVENLVRESFWNVYRPGCAEHYVLHTLRTCPDFVKELDFVMEKFDSQFPPKQKLKLPGQLF